MALTTHNHVPVPSFMYGTAWKKEATTQLVQLAVAAGFTAIDTANQLIHYQEALVGEALLTLAQQGVTRDRLFLQTKFTPTNGQDHRTPYDASANSHDPSDSVLRQLAGPPAHRLPRLLRLARALSAAGIGRFGLGGLGRDRRALSIRENKNDRYQQRHG